MLDIYRTLPNFKGKLRFLRIFLNKSFLKKEISFKLKNIDLLIYYGILLLKSGGTTVDTYMTVKGQIVIPSKIRSKLGMKEGTRIQVDVDEQTHKIILTPITRDYIESLRGKYKGKGLLKALAAEKKREKEL